MKRERLMELRKRVFADCQELDVKCSQDGFQEATPTGKMDSDGNDLTALIDAEIARQSVTDEQIRTALDYVNDYKKVAREYDTSVGIFPPTSEEVRAWETVETALRQYQKPTDEAVRVAIDWLEAEKASAQNDWERAGAEWRMEPGAQAQHDERMASLDLAIQALRQMRTEPGWIKVSDRLPEKSEYDWVLVHITLSPDGFVGLPHVAELRRGKWFSTEYDLPIEQILQGTVTHWMPLPKPPESEV